MAKLFHAAKPAANKQHKLVGQTIKLAIERLDINGVGVGRYQKKPVFVANALVGEQVQAKVLEANSKFIKAKAIKVSALSKHRKKPLCQHYYVCGGCDLQHLDDDTQLAFKQQKVADLFSRQGITDLPWQAAISEQPWHYRRKARIGVQYNKLGEAILGFRQKESNTLTAIKQCHVLLTPIADIFTKLAAILDKLALPNAIGHIEVIQTQQTSLVVRQLRPLSAPAIAIWQQAAHQHGWHMLFDDGSRLVSLAQAVASQQVNDESSPISVEESNEVNENNNSTALSYSLGTNSFGTTNFDTINFSFQASDFIQVNQAVNQAMVEQAITWLDVRPDDVILDLFCGLGNFSLPLAKQAHHVTGVEGVQTMVARASNNAKANHISNACFHQLDLNADWQEQPWLSDKFTKVLLDPARAGALQACQQLLTLAVDSILYVSCEPQSLARDAKLLCSHGYSIKKIAVIDMFAQTKHVETMVLFQR